jgi:CRP/FNR family transcriptional regulator, anaerobic regulatory protein
MTEATPDSTVHRVRIVSQATTRATRAPVAQAKAHCSTCHLRELCLPRGMGDIDLTRLDGLAFTRRRIKAGETLYREGDRFQYIYAVRSGTLKSSLILSDGREQVSGFHIAGDVVGLDGVAQGRHASATMALEDTEVCAISYTALAELAISTSGMQHIVSRLISREILREHTLMMLLGSMNAEERLAAFLLNLSKRYADRGYSATEFHLRMSRAELGSYLGMKLETISRTFSAFQQQGLMQVDKRHIRITDLEQLRRRFDVRVH